MTIQTNGDDCRESGAEETSRRAFEGWAINQCRFDLRYSDPARKTYASMKTRQAWIVWQASRSAIEIEIYDFDTFSPYDCGDDAVWTSELIKTLAKRGLTIKE